MTGTELTAGQPCGGCRHLLDPHVLVAREFSALAGQPDVPVSGVMFCPECPCCITWSVSGWPRPARPGEHELAALREAAF